MTKLKEAEQRVTGAATSGVPKQAKAARIEAESSQHDYSSGYEDENSHSGAEGSSCAALTKKKQQYIE